MNTTYTILVIIDPQHNNSPVINRAKEVASNTKAKIHLLACSESPQKGAVLQPIVDTLQKEGFTVTSEVAWKESYHNTITHVQQTQGGNLIIKSHVPENAIKKVILTPEDWKLLRNCACPVLIVNQDKPWKNRPVLAAIDLGNPEKNHVILHNTLVEVADTLTKITEGNLHLVSVYPAPIFSEINLQSRVAGMTPEIFSIYDKACTKYKEQYHIPDEQVHLVAGAPDIVIPQIAQDIDASVCVIGTVARTGISGVLIGNTAESILDDLISDILVIKPDSIDNETKKLIAQVAQN